MQAHRYKSTIYFETQHSCKSHERKKIRFMQIYVNGNFLLLTKQLSCKITKQTVDIEDFSHFATVDNVTHKLSTQGT